MPHRNGPKFYKLHDSVLYKVTTRRRLAEILLCSLDHLKSVCSLENQYKHRWKHKTDDKAPWLTEPPKPSIAHEYRPIDVPEPSLKKLQARVASILSKIEPPEFLFSPVKGRSYVENAKRHSAGTAFWQLDVADYFPSCTDNRVAWFFRTVLQCAPDVTAILVRVTCDAGRLPQGSPASPILAYFSNSKMWNDVDATVREAGCVTSIYADDITVSGDLIRASTVWAVKKIIHNNGFKLKDEKELSTVSSPADITGVIVDRGKLRLPNRQLKKLKVLVVEAKNEADRTKAAKMQIQIQGRLAQRKQIEGAN